MGDLKFLKKVKGSKLKTVKMEEFPSIGDLVPQKKNKKYVSYKGSLTTPPCLEIVNWNISLDPEFISYDQVCMSVDR